MAEKDIVHAVEASNYGAHRVDLQLVGSLHAAAAAGANDDAVATEGVWDDPNRAGYEICRDLRSHHRDGLYHANFHVHVHDDASPDVLVGEAADGNGGEAGHRKDDEEGKEEGESGDDLCGADEGGGEEEDDDEQAVRNGPNLPAVCRDRAFASIPIRRPLLLLPE